MAQEITCKQCGQKFGSNEQLEQHNRQLHGSGGMAGTSGTAGGMSGTANEMGGQRPAGDVEGGPEAGKTGRGTQPAQGDVGKQR